MKKKLTSIILLGAAFAIVLFASAQTTGTKTSPVKKKYAYCQLYYSHLWDSFKENKHEFVIHGVSDQLKNSVNSSRHITPIMTLLGTEGWELVAAFDESVHQGTQYTYYFKKEVN